MRIHLLTIKSSLYNFVIKCTLRTCLDFPIIPTLVKVFRTCTYYIVLHSHTRNTKIFVNLVEIIFTEGKFTEIIFTRAKIFTIKDIHNHGQVFQQNMSDFPITLAVHCFGVLDQAHFVQYE